MSQSKGYGQFCPVSRAAEVLAERWTPLVIRELLCGSVRFNDLQRGVPRMSSSLLAKRLKELEYADIVERRPAASGSGNEYHLTSAGRELYPVLEAMGLWAQRWSREQLILDENLDPDLLMWDIRRRVEGQGLGDPERFVVRFQLSGVPANQQCYWIVFLGDDADLCLKPPGFEENLTVGCHIRNLVQIWLGYLSIKVALRQDLLKLDGTPADRKRFASWFSLSVFAGAGREPAGVAGTAD